jgi:hypothetical protein
MVVWHLVVVAFVVVTFVMVAFVVAAFVVDVVVCQCFKPHLKEQGPGAAKRQAYRPCPEGEAPEGDGEEGELRGKVREGGEGGEKRGCFAGPCP